MKKLFIIGTGRNGSKLTGRVIGTAVDIKYRQGEVHHGLNPIFFKDSYLGNISSEQTIKKFKASRDKPIQNCPDIYVEKNHLVVPILEQLLTAYPDAMFLYVKRNTKDIVRSFYARDVYGNVKNMYEEGRLSPNVNDQYYNKWPTMSKFDKICWYVATMTRMCEATLSTLPSTQYRVVSYDEFVKDKAVFEEVFKWLGLDFNLEKIKIAMSAQIGSSARSPKEVKYKVTKPGSFKKSEHWKDWSDDKKQAYNRFFNE